MILGRLPETLANTNWGNQNLLFSSTSVRCHDDTSGISARQEIVHKQGSYEGHGKTSVAILNDDCDGVNMVDSYSQDGFRLNDDTKILGPCVVFPTAVLGGNLGDR